MDKGKREKGKKGEEKKGVSKGPRGGHEARRGKTKGRFGRFTFYSQYVRPATGLAPTTLSTCGVSDGI